ncbi:MAG: hypothetical protein AAGF31_02915 [Planctomycetota bacterium]
MLHRIAESPQYVADAGRQRRSPRNVERQGGTHGVIASNHNRFSGHLADLIL